ncbi:hypothetical protein GLOTRDRAFT_127083 [Gloeophyllum trabeum ATCC 11539]|uniref:Uncharacterized protein n=1 Tax=Gloeophyllum trabeum (strain ATCC 11539 / FP-39264 / Madison 617) TaxID=670483 RepID=S7QFH7_GLOTA|nr:uncharacterized protein GLOTRDRAFT_127083 [Gloeophyllum trabeum ATCC 11539]EPQ58586.1 hypothetical protein GLOTRDRAFT_127083 [Gloeophyllum trabeum ATCC 11539]
MATICKKPLHKEEWGCKFSHDLLEMGRLKGLLGDIEVLREPLEYLTLEYVGSFEAFGHHESWGEGWRMTVRARELHGLFNEISPPIVIEAENVNEVINKVEDELLWNGYSTGRAEHMVSGRLTTAFCGVLPVV